MDSRTRHLVSTLWWIILIRGLAAIAFGIVAVFWPGLTLIVLVYLFAGYILISGLLNIIFSIYSAGRMSMWLLMLILGILELGVGVYVIRHPEVSLAAFLLLIGFTFVFRGSMELVLTFMQRAPDGANRILLAISGILSVILGVYIIMQPVAGGLAFIWAVGLFALITGSMEIARASAAKAELERVLNVSRSHT